MNQRYDEVKDLFFENKIAVLIVINLVLTIYFGSKILNTPTDEKFTRIILDHNTKEDLSAIKREVCYRGLRSILSKDVDKKFVEIELANKLIDADYANFEVENTESIHVAMRSDVVCTAMLKYEDRSTRAFDVDIIENREGAALLFSIQDINETLLRERI